MNDRELLELAAKSVGRIFLNGRWDYPGLHYLGGAPWNPLTDDGDAFRLAVRLKLILEPALSQCNDVTYTHVGYSELPNTVDARRAAIVQCAASIGASL